MFKPMLAGKCEDINTLKYPLYASAKLDGVRALIIGGQVMSRNLKPIPNAWVQRMFSGLPEGTDGELIFGDPCHKDAYRNTVSAVMSEDGEPEQVKFHVFDNYLYDGSFELRYLRIPYRSGCWVTNAHRVHHTKILSAEELAIYEEGILALGYEGVMVRSIDGPYKQGRSTEREGYLLKVKRFVDAEAVVLGTYEWQTNTNEATENALGHTERSSHKEGKVGAGVLGGLLVRGLNGAYEGIEYSVGTGFSGADDPEGERGKLWRERELLIGSIVKVKYFPTGSDTRPRFPVFLGWRDAVDF